MVTGLLLLGVIISFCISSDNFFAQSLMGDARGALFPGDAASPLLCSELTLCGTAGGGGLDVGVSAFVSCELSRSSFPLLPSL